VADFKKRLSIQFLGLKSKLMIGFTLISLIPLLALAYLFIYYPFVDIPLYDFIILTISIIIALLGFWILRDLINPILKLTEWARLINKGDVTQRLKKERTDEIGELFDFFNNVTEKLQQDMERIRELSITDELTGTYNYRHFYRSLGDEISRVHRYKYPLSLAMLDIDYFKRNNDTYGHLVGDLILKEIAQLLGKSCRNVDILARYGGEEFVFILPHTPESQGLVFAERIRRLVEGHRFAPGAGIPQECRITISVGVAGYKEGDTAESIINKSDHALYKAKESGRNKACSFSMTV